MLLYSVKKKNKEKQKSWCQIVKGFIAWGLLVFKTMLRYQKVSYKETLLKTEQIKQTNKYHHPFTCQDSKSLEKQLIRIKPISNKYERPCWNGYTKCALYVHNIDFSALQNLERKTPWQNLLISIICMKMAIVERKNGGVHVMQFAPRDCGGLFLEGCC